MTHKFPYDHAWLIKMNIGNTNPTISVSTPHLGPEVEIPEDEGFLRADVQLSVWKALKATKVRQTSYFE